MQSGFLKDGSIIKNFSIAIEMVQCCNRLKRPTIILKLDFQKGFDRGFPNKWIWWVSHLLHTSMAQILINGKVGEKFKIQKGVRQDPLSPYLYILVANVLQQMIRKALGDEIVIHPIENGAPLPVLLYANDTLLILHGSVQHAIFAKSTRISTTGYNRR
jgi:hypothetical protein